MVLHSLRQRSSCAHARQKQTQTKRLTSALRRSLRQSLDFKPALEPLEDRRLMAADLRGLTDDVDVILDEGIAQGVAVANYVFENILETNRHDSNHHRHNPFDPEDVNDDVEFFDNEGRPITFDYIDDYGNTTTVEGEIALFDAFFNPTMFKQTGVDGILKYAASTHAEEIDNQLVDSLRNFLFGQPGQGGLDLASLNIQRGRDHGLADYVGLVDRRLGQRWDTGSGGWCNWR